jgi:site-specific DNA recombinase
VRSGVEVHFYQDRQQFKFGTMADNVVGMVRAEMNAEYRRQIRVWTTDAMRLRAKAGRVTGGRVFGYANHRVAQGHVERRRNDAEAAVVLRIFELFDSGYGLKRIAKLLSIEEAPAPQPFQRKDAPVRKQGAWSPSTVRAVLSRELYHGVVVWNRTMKRNADGEVAPTDRPESEWLRIPAPELKLVPDDLWKRVSQRRKEVEGRSLRFSHGRISGRPPKHGTQNLLAGLATCGVCGGGMVAEVSSRKRGLNVPVYVCYNRRVRKGCSNRIHVSTSVMNEAVLQAVEQHALTAEAVEQVLQLAERDDDQDRQASIQHELRDVQRRIGRLVSAIETGSDAASVIAKLRQLEERQSQLQIDLRSFEPVPRLPSPVLESRLAEWRRLLRQSPTQGRAVLQRVLSGRITFTPDPEGVGYTFAAPTRFDKLFAGLVYQRRPPFLKDGDRRGLEQLLEAEDADYSNVLQRAMERVLAKGMASPEGLTPFCESSDGKRDTSPTGIEPVSRP